MLKRSLGGIPFQLRYYGLTQFNAIASSGPIVILDFSSVGTLSRASSGSYLAGATSSLAWALPNVRRFEDRGDGFGPNLLLEGRRVNYAKTSEQLLGGDWGGNTSPPSFNNLFVAPDGDLDADLYVNSNGAGICFQQFPEAGNGVGTGLLMTASFSVWGYSSGANANGGVATRNINSLALGLTAKNVQIGSWARLDWHGTFTGSAALHNYIYIPQFHGTASWWGTQLEFSSTFPTSYYATTTVTGTREADRFSIAPASIPDAVGSGSFYFDLYPAFSAHDAMSASAMTPSNGRFDILSFGPTSYLILSGTGFRLSASEGMPTELSTSALTWNRHQKLRIVVAADQGYIEISGATSGNGRYWTSTSLPFKFLTASSLVIGSTSGTNANPYFGRISNFILTGSNPLLIDLATDGLFSRASSGSYLIGGPTNGSVAFLAFANLNEKRFEDRGDGFGRNLLLEGSRTNNISLPRDISGTSWLAGATGITTSLDYARGVDATMVADLIEIPAGQYSKYQQFNVVTGSRYSYSFWAARPIGSGSDEVHFALQDGANGTGPYRSLPVHETFSRFDAVRTMTASIGYCVPGEGRTFGGITQRALKYLTDLHQFELGGHPSSPIFPGAGTTRATDVLSISPNQIAKHLTSGTFSFDIWPDFSSGEATASLGITLSSGTFNLLSYGSADFIQFSGSKLLLSASIGFGAPAIVSDAMTWDRYQKMTITVDSRSGTLEISGVVGAGKFFNATQTGWSFATNSTLVIGSASGTNASPYFGRISNFRSTTGSTDVLLDLLTQGNFVRPSSGTYLLSAPTDGTTAFLAHAPHNVRRPEDRGDTGTPVLLLEGTKTNHFIDTRNPVAWGGGLAAHTASFEAGPDGRLSGTRVMAASNEYSNWQAVANFSGAYVGSQWQKAGPGPNSGSGWQLRINANGGGYAPGARTGDFSGNLWRRNEVQIDQRANSLASFTAVDTRNFAGAAGGEAAIARDVIVDFYQVEKGEFPTSAIWVTGAVLPQTRATDVLSFAPNQVSREITSGTFSFDIWPDFSSNEATSSLAAVTGGNVSGTFNILSYGPSDYLAFSGSKLVLTSSIGFGGAPIVTEALSWNRYQKMTIVINSKSGTLEVSGVVNSGRYFNATQTGWTFSTGSSLVIGSASGTNASPFFGRISNLRTTGSNPILLDFANMGVFSRPSTGSYLIAAPTDGQTPFMVFAGPNVRRVENRGDGHGPQFFTEGTRTNYIVQSRQLSSSAWTPNGTTRTGSATISPDGLMSGTRVVSTGSNLGTIAGGHVFSVQDYTLSIYTKGMSSSQSPWSFGLAVGAISQQYLGMTGTGDNTVWTRRSLAGRITPTQTLYAIFNNASIISAVGFIGIGHPALPRDHAGDLTQIEDGIFPSSPIWTLASTVTRTTDILSFAPNQIPREATSGTFSFDIWPDFSSNEATASLSHSVATGTFNILSYGPSDYIQFSGSKIKLTASIGFTGPEIVTDALSWNRAQKITITVNPKSGTLEVSGAAGSGRFYNSASVGWQFSTGSTLVVGSASGTNASPFFGRISNVRVSGTSDNVLIDMATMGVFTRASSGSYFIAPMTGGNTISLAWAPPNQRRMDNRDGSGSLYYTEGSRTNLLPFSRIASGSGANWTEQGSTYWQNSGSSMDGQMLAQRVQTANGQRGRTYVNTPGMVSGTNYVGSIYARTNPGSGSQLTQISFDSSGFGDISKSGTINESWSRLEVTTKPDAATPWWSPWCGINFGGGGTLAIDNLVDLQQVEAGTFASSPIWTSGTAAVTRGADTLRIPTGSFPTSILSGGAYEFDIYPDFLPMHMHSAAAGQRLFDVRHPDYAQSVQLSYNITSDPARIFVYSTGSASGQLGNTFSWGTVGQKLCITLKPSEGWIEVSGASVGGGKITVTPWQWTPVDYLQIGSLASGGQPFFGRISNFFVSGSRSPISLDLFDETKGTFTRSTSGSYFSGAMNVIAWQPANTKRIEITGSDNIQWLKMEGARTNLLSHNHPSSGSSWTDGAGDQTTGLITGIDGIPNTATRLSHSTTGYVVTARSFTIGSRYSLSCFGQGTSGSQSHVLRVSLVTAALLTSSVRTVAQGVFSRQELAFTASGATGNVYISEGRNTSAEGGAAVGSRDIIVDLPQLEAGGFPSSPIWVTGSEGTRAQDSLIYTLAQLPPTFATKGFTFSFAPDYSSAELIAGGSAIVLLSRVGIGTLLQFSFIGSNAALYATTAAGTIGTSTLTWSRNQTITITVNYEVGTITVLGATTGNGTYSIAPFPLTTSGLGFGPAFGRFGRFVQSL